MPSIMAWMHTLGEMKLYGTRLSVSCGRCGFWRRVEVDEMIEILGGPDMTVWDCRPPCEAEMCDGSMIFMASPGSGTPFRPLYTTTFPETLPAQAWMAGWPQTWALRASRTSQYR